jgi:hypothetical protein
MQRLLVTVASLVAAAALAGCHGGQGNGNEVVGAGVAGAGVGAAIGSLAGVAGMLPGAAVGAAIGAGVQTATNHPYPKIPEDQPSPAPNPSLSKP